jgi:hypothetical protein
MITVQQEQHVDVKPVELPIYLANGNRIFLSCLTSDQADDIFEARAALMLSLASSHAQAVCRDIELVPELTYYFGLFIIETV